MDGNERIGPFSYKVSRGWDGNYPLGDEIGRVRVSTSSKRRETVPCRARCVDRII